MNSELELIWLDDYRCYIIFKIRFIKKIYKGGYLINGIFKHRMKEFALTLKLVEFYNRKGCKRFYIGTGSVE